MDENYVKMLKRYKELEKLISESKQGFEEFEDEWHELQDFLLTNNNFENTIDGKTALKIIRDSQQIYLDAEGGWPIEEERAFEVNGKEYSVIAWSVSGADKYALKGIVFVKD